jgi:transposase
MGKTYRPYDPNQLILLPPNMREWLPADHMAYFISDVVDELDISGIERVYEEELRGYPPYHPRMMLKLLIYGYCNGVRSSRKIAQKVEEDIAFRYLAGGNMPKFRSIAEFRMRHLQEFKQLFLQVLQICKHNGMASLGHVALDGTKIKANASKHKAMSYGHMKKEEERLIKEIETLVREAERLDQEEDKHYGKKRRENTIPQELLRREERLKKIREARQAIEQETKEKEHSKDDHNCDPPSAPAVPADKTQRNFTDPESKIMPKEKTFIQGYNAQAAVDSDFQIIVACDLVNHSSDSIQLSSMVNQVRSNTTQKPDGISADAGYFSKKNVLFLRSQHIAAYIPPDKQRHNITAKCPRGPITKDMSVADRMRRWLLTKRGRAQYALRKITVEPVFGQIKRVMGFSEFSFRGLEKNRAEWDLVCLCHNLKKLYRYSPAKA